MDYFKFSDLTDLRNFMLAFTCTSGNAYRLHERGIIEKFYVSGSGDLLVDSYGAESYIKYLTDNTKTYRLRTEKVKPCGMLPVCELNTYDEIRRVIGSNSGDTRFNYFTQNTFSAEKYDTMRVCAIDCEYSESGAVSEVGFYDIKTNRSILFRLPSDQRKSKPKTFSVANGIEVIVKSGQQMFDEVARTLKHYDIIVMHGVVSDIKAFRDVGRGDVITDKIVVDTSTMYDTINQYALNVVVNLLDIREDIKYHNAGNDAWYVSQVFKKLVRFI